MQNMEIFSVVKNENFIRFFFLIFAQNIDCRYSLEPPYEYPQSMFWSKKKKIGIPQFCCIKVGFKGIYIIRTCFPDGI